MVEIFNDIRKIYEFSEACAPLEPYVEFFSETSVNLTRTFIGDEPFTVEMFASWTPTIWINLGSPYQLDTSFGKFRIQPDQDIVTLRDTPVTRNNCSADHIFTVKFFPGGLEAVTGFNQYFLKGRILNAVDIFPYELLASIKKQSNFKARQALVEAYLLSCLAGRKQPVDHYLRIVTDSIALYEEGTMCYNTSQLAEKMFVSSKSINRYFTRVVGTAPKRYFSMLRARKAVTAFISGRKVFDPSQFGYYDLSHFHREAFQFTGRRLSAMG